MPVALVGGAMGLINALGNLDGFVGPSAGGFLQDVSGHSFLSTAVVPAVALVLGGLVMLTQRGQADKPVLVPRRKPPPLHPGPGLPPPSGRSFPAAGDGVVGKRRASGQVVRHAGSGGTR